MWAFHRRLVCGALLMAPAAPLHAAEFRGLGDLPGGPSGSLAAAVSVDGRHVVGGSYSDVSSEPFIWDQEHGLRRLDNILTVITPGAANDVSANGAVVVGWAEFDNVMPFRWQDAGFRFLDVQYPGVANAVTANGAVVVGTENYSSGGGPAAVTGTAFRWSEAEGAVRLADLPGGPDCARANDISASGSVIVGTGDCGASFQVEDQGTAVRWVNGGPAQPLGSLLESGVGASRALAISQDGKTIVGSAESELGREPFLWREGEGMIGLGRLDDAAVGEALGVTGNGRIAVGYSGDRAFFWTAQRGMTDLKELLSDHNFKLDLSGWTLTKATGISPDGLHIVGEGINPEGEIESWWTDLYHIPIYNNSGDIDITDLNNVRNNFGAAGLGDMPPYDGVIDIYDLNFVRNSFGRPPGSSTVPEPGSLLLGLLGASAAAAALSRGRSPRLVA